MKNLTRNMAALVSFTFFVNLFLFRVVTPLSTALFLLGLCAYIVVIAQYRHRSMIVLALTCVYSVAVLWMRAAHFIQVQSIVAMVFLTGSLWYISISESESFGSFTAVFLSPFFAGLTYIKRGFSLIMPSTIAQGYKRGIQLFGDRQKHSRLISTIIGLVIALPVTLILVSMFASADPIYYSYLKKILSPEFLQTLPLRIILSFLIIGFATPFIFPKIRRIFISPGTALARLQITHELTIVMSVIALIIASFIIIQWPYVFVNVKSEINLSRFGVATYAEYVTKGFIELLRVSVFIYALLWLGLTTLRQNEIKPKMLSILQWVVMGEFFIIVVSIARRVYLYQMYHGLTLIRVYGFFFLIWLACMAFTLAGRHITSKVRFGAIEGLITIFLFVILGVWNVEHYIAVFHPPTVNKRVDYVYLSRMSADGVDGWINAYTHAKQIIEKYTNTSGEIDKNARREIAYAEYILRRMTYQQYDYMNKYANPIEVKNYTKSLVDFQIKRLDVEKNELIAYRLKKPSETWVDNRLFEITQIKKDLKKKEELSPKNRVVEQASATILYDISIDTWQNLQSFDLSLVPTLHSFYNTRNMPIPETSEITKLDHLYLQNASDMKAFQIIKQAMPIATLHELQIKYYDLAARIGRQATRDYETDISLDSPLL